MMKIKLTFLNVGPLQKPVGTNWTWSRYKAKNRDEWERGGRKGGQRCAPSCVGGLTYDSCCCSSQITWLSPNSTFGSQVGIFLLRREGIGKL